MTVTFKTTVDKIKDWENFMVGDTILKSHIKVHEQKVLTRPKCFIDCDLEYCTRRSKC